MGLPAVLSLLLAGGFYWLLHTTSGALWIWVKAQQSTAGALDSSLIDGDLSSGLVIEGLGYQAGGVGLQIGRVELMAGPGWWPLSIQLRSLRVQDMTLDLPASTVPTSANQSPSDLGATLAAMIPPMLVELHDGQLDGLTLHRGGTKSSVQIDTLRIQLSMDEKLVIKQLDITTPTMESNGNGQMNLKAPFGLMAELQGQLFASTDPDAVAPIVPFGVRLSGNLNQARFSLNSEPWGLQLGGDLFDLLTDPGWDISANLAHYKWNGSPDLTPIAVSDLVLTSQGQLDQWWFELDSGLEMDALPTSKLSISGEGSATSIEFEQIRFSGPAMELRSQGHGDWSGQPEASLTTRITRLDLSQWLHDWPADKYLLGDLSLEWSPDRLLIPQSRLAIDGTNAVVNITADIDTEANTVDARIDWQDLAWPPVNPEYSSSAGEWVVSGDLDNWNTHGQMKIRLGDYPTGRLELDGSGDRTSARVELLRGQVLRGNITGEAGVNWSENLTWDANFRASGLDPEPVLPGWPGAIDAVFSIQSQTLPRHTRLNLSVANGQLRGIPLNASGSVSYDENGLTFDQVSIATDEALLKLDGNISTRAGASVSFNGLLPSALMNGAGGMVELDGHYSGHANQPSLTLQLAGQELAWNGYAVRDLEFSSSLDRDTSPVPGIELRANGLILQETVFESLTMSLEPGPVRQNLKVQVKHPDFVVGARAEIEPQDAQDPYLSKWQGVLQELEASVLKDHHFKLEKASPLSWSPDVTSAGPVCLQANNGASVCIDTQYRHGDHWSLVMETSAIPVDLVAHALDLDVGFDQQIAGRLEWYQKLGEAATGGAEFHISGGSIFEITDNTLIAETGAGRLVFSLQNGNLESGTLDIPLPGTGEIDLDFDVLDIAADGARELIGRANVEMDDIGLLGQLAMPAVDELSGRFVSNIKLSGTLADPHFSGEFSLDNGLIGYDLLGLRLEDIDVNGHVDAHDRGIMSGQFKAGEGTGKLDGRFVFEDLKKIRLEASLTGENLLLVNTDQLKLSTETDLKLELKPERLDINGYIRVPSAQLTPVNLLVGRINDSEDLLIEDRTIPVDGIQAKQAKTQIHGSLDLAFGDDVQVGVPGVETSISGSVNFLWDGEPVPVANGEYRLQGTVDVYGPVLVIENGHINFPNVPANNPVLNIRAERGIYGNTQVRSAGVQVGGTLKRSTLKAYTNPLTNEDRAWAILITGSDFDYGQSVGGFDVGTYIAPKLYVSYGISLFDDENVLSARYDLKKGFGIKVTSGQQDSGVDMSYTLDR